MTRSIHAVENEDQSIGHQLVCGITVHTSFNLKMFKSLNVLLIDRDQIFVQ